MTFKEELQQNMTAFGIHLTEQQVQQFCSFEEALMETNTVMNLTAITDPQEVAVKHMVDSLSYYEERYIPSGSSLLDLGTGAGFPGLPLLIYRPDLKVTFFDSLQKRLNFVQSVTMELGLNASFLHGRAEDEAHKKEYREQFDIVTSRAVARLAVLCEWALPYVAKGGMFISLKGAQYEEEAREARHALEIVGGVIEEIRAVHLPGIADKRAVLYIRKVQDSPKKYPRKPKIAAKNPL